VVVVAGQDAVRDIEDRDLLRADVHPPAQPWTCRVAVPFSSTRAEHPATELATTDAFADLLGRTISAVLRALVHPAITTQLSRRVGISPTSTSGHTRVHRAASLITTVRAQGTALHT
jgi:DNA-binding transcriptional ArsR family regulator